MVQLSPRSRRDQKSIVGRALDSIFYDHNSYLSAAHTMDPEDFDRLTKRESGSVSHKAILVQYRGFGWDSLSCWAVGDFPGLAGRNHCPELWFWDRDWDCWTVVCESVAILVLTSAGSSALDGGWHFGYAIAWISNGSADGSVR